MHRLIRYERLFDTVVRNYSLLGDTNGERWLLTLMDESPLVFDIGFHDGASTQQMLCARPKAHVVGFDPSRFALQNYQANLAAYFPHHVRKRGSVQRGRAVRILRLREYVQ